MSADVELESVSIRFGSFTAVKDANFRINGGEFFSILGPSGCGKTTLLRTISGFFEPTAGRVRIGGQDMAGIGPNRRPTALIFQNLALFPLMSVADNIGYGLRVRGVSRADRDRKVSDLLKLVALPDQGHKRISELSGGQKQRVAIARALAVEPKVLLLDEPLSALDLRLRQHMRNELRAIQKRVGITFIYITHDQGEALTMSDRIAVMNRGRIEQFATPEAIYARPATPFALEFVGLSTRIAGTVTTYDDAGFVTVETPQGPLRAKGRFAVGSPVLLGIRPECIRFGEGGGENRIAPVLTDIVFQGARVQAHFESQSDLPILIETSTGLPSELAAGMPVPLSFAVEDTLAYPAEVAR